MGKLSTVFHGGARDNDEEEAPCSASILGNSGTVCAPLVVRAHTDLLEIPILPKITAPISSTVSSKFSRVLGSWCRVSRRLAIETGQEIGRAASERAKWERETSTHSFCGSASTGGPTDGGDTDIADLATLASTRPWTSRTSRGHRHRHRHHHRHHHRECTQDREPTDLGSAALHSGRNDKGRESAVCIREQTDSVESFSDIACRCSKPIVSWSVADKTANSSSEAILSRATSRYCRSRSDASSKIGVASTYSCQVPHGILFGLFAMTLLFVPVPGVPMPSHQVANGGPYQHASYDTFEDAFDEPFEDHEATGGSLDESEIEILRQSIVQGLGLRKIPDPSKANVSQAAYERAHREYLNGVQQALYMERGSRERRSLHVFAAREHPGNRSDNAAGSWEVEHYRHSLFFSVEIPDEEIAVDHASLRLLLQGHSDDHTELDASIYLKTAASRKLIAKRKIHVHEPRSAKWLEFDSTDAISTWLERNRGNLGLELEFHRNGAPIDRTVSSPVLNVFTGSEEHARRKRSSPEDLMSLHKGRRTKCKGESKKCCRHELTVMFKDLKGFEFIVYPKMFDAGYCKGRCPPRYNPAHHHALLQSLLWKEDRKKVPKPCCAPSKLDQLMIVYFDENDATELKVSYWKNIQVLECACS